MENIYFKFKSSCVFLLLVLSSFAFAQTTQTFTTSGSFLVPAGVTSITVEAWGAGGGGGSSFNDVANGSSGGGGGAYSKGTYTVIPGSTYYYNVGTKGIGGKLINTKRVSTQGTSSWFNATESTNTAPADNTVGTLASGGGAGKNNSTVVPSNGGLAADSFGNISSLSGLNGSAATGSAGGSGGAGANSGGAGGEGGIDFPVTQAANGTAPGGGGGGSSDIASALGGDGGDGQITITYFQAAPYQAEIISADFGASTWCAGETRTVKVTIKNVGTEPWQDTSTTEFNIGIKWNTNGDSWNDYNVKVDAGNLAVGDTKTYELTITASNNLNATVSPTPGYTTPLAEGVNNLSFDVVEEGVAWFASNTNGVGPGNEVYTTSNINIVAKIGTIGEITGSKQQCAGNTAQVYSIEPVDNATTYTWSVPSSWIIVSGNGTPSIIVNIASNGTSGNVSVTASNTGCATSRFQFVNVSPPTVAGTLSPVSTTVCSGLNSTNLNLSGYTGTILRWESSLDNFAEGGAVTNISNTGTPITVQNITTDTYFRAVVKSGGCDLLYSNIVKISVVGQLGPTGEIAGAKAQCAGNTSQIYSVDPVTNATTYTWSVPSNWTIVSGNGTNSITVDIPLGGFSNIVSVVAGNNICPNSEFKSSYVAVSPPTVAGTISPAATTVCSVSNSTNLNLSGYTGTILRWESSLDNFAPGGTVSTISSTGSPITANNLTTDTYFRAVVQSGGCALLYSNIARIVVKSQISAGTISSASSSVCVGFTTQYSTDGDIGGFWSSSNTGVATVDSTTGVVTGVATGTATIYYTLSGFGCGLPQTAQTTITVTSSVDVSVSITADTNIICEGAGTLITFTAVPVNGGAPSYQWQVNGVNAGTDSATFASSTLAVGDIVRVILTSSLSSCVRNSPAISNEITIIAQTTVYNSGWTINPAPNLSVEIQSAYSSSIGNLDICSIEIKAPVTINTDGYFKVQNGVTISSGGSLVVQSDGNLVQYNNSSTINSGDITVEKVFTFQSSADIPNRQQYNYVTSPVIGQNLQTIYAGNPTTLYYNEASNFFGFSSGVYIPGRGLAVKEPSEAAVSNSTVTAQFNGSPFNGILEYQLAYTPSIDNLYGYNLVGNPYPSNIDLQLLYDYDDGTDKNSDKIEPTFQFWDNRGNREFTQLGSSYKGDSYAKYNVVSATGVASASAAPNSTSFTDPRIPNQYVQVGNGFIVRALNSANGKNLVFNNVIRTTEKGKSYFGKKTPKDRYWLTLKTPSGLVFMNAIVYFDGGNNLFGVEDSKVLETSDGIYSIVEDQKLAIQGRATFTNTDKVALGVSAFVDGTYTISSLDKEGVFAQNQNIYLKDNKIGTLANLSAGDYSFTATSGEIAGRFEIIYQPDIVLVTDSNVKENLLVYKEDDNFVIKAQADKITKVEVYDMSGRLVYEILSNDMKVSIPAQYFVQGVYILNINQKDEVTVKKIVK